MAFAPRFVTGLVFFFLTSSNTADAQDLGEDLSALLEGEKKKTYAIATFKTTRIINGHSIENTAKGVLDFRVSHRFGNISGGFDNFFGLDNATTRLGFDYGITDWLTAGWGRNTLMREFDGFLKIKLLRQTEDDKTPVSVSYVGIASVTANKVNTPPGLKYYFSNRLAFGNQLLIARKFNNSFSLQFTPTHLHYNLVAGKNDPNDIFALGIGGRYKLSDRMALTAEYHYLISRLQNTRNTLSIGLDIETGGHVFQLMLSNGMGITERYFVGQTEGSWARKDSKGRFTSDIQLGFTISRVFTIIQPKGFEGSRNTVW